MVSSNDEQHDTYCAEEELSGMLTWRVHGPALGARHESVPGTGEIGVNVPVRARAGRTHDKPAEVWLLRPCLSTSTHSLSASPTIAVIQTLYL